MKAKRGSRGVRNLSKNQKSSEERSGEGAQKRSKTRTKTSSKKLSNKSVKSRPTRNLTAGPKKPMEHKKSKKSKTPKKAPRKTKHTLAQKKLQLKSKRPKPKGLKKPKSTLRRKVSSKLFSNLKRRKTNNKPLQKKVQLRKRKLGTLSLSKFKKRSIRRKPLKRRLKLSRITRPTRKKQVTAELLRVSQQDLSTPASAPESPVSVSTQESVPSASVTSSAAVQAAQVTALATPEPAPTPATAPPPGATQGISTQEFLRPNDQLRKSIEAFLMDQRSLHTRKAYGKDLKRFVRFLHGRKQKQGIENITRTVLIAYKESLLNEGLEHTTVDRHIATLRSFFGWLVDDDLIAKNPADGVRFLNPKRLSTTRGFSDDEVRKVLALPDLHTRTGSQHYAILMILFYCGLRRSEICELRTRNVTVERNQYILKLRGKGNKERLIVMIPQVWNAVKHYLLITGRELMSDDHLFKPMRNNRTGVLKKGLDPSMIFYIVTRYAKLAGIAARVSPHSCRATAISNARDHQVPDRAIQEFAGWSSPDMITRYDKRKTSIENSAAHAISYGQESRKMPEGASLSAPPSSSSKPDSESKEPTPEPPATLK